LEAQLAEANKRIAVDAEPCTCGYGGFHEPLNPRCERNITAALEGNSDD
jgi:hypothetical protein